MKKNTAISLALVSLVSTVSADPGWVVKEYGTGGFNVTNYATADALIGGSHLLSSQTSSFTNSATQDNGGSGPFGVGVQLPGLPAGDNDDFVFQATGTFTVATAGNYTFYNDTDDGSRLRLSINGGAFTDIITDNVLSGSHTVPSSPVALNAGATINLQWMWFERSGGAEGQSFYSRDGGPTALWQTTTQGLTLVGGAFNGTMYKANNAATQPNPGNLAQGDNLVTNGTFEGQSIVPTINFGSGGHTAGESPFPGVLGDNFTLSATGYINITNAGAYTFFTNSDDGARLRVDGADVVVDDFQQGPVDSAYVSVNLGAGFHKLEFTGFELGGGESFEAWIGQGNLAAAKGAGVFDPATFHLIGDASYPVFTEAPEPGTAGLLLGVSAMGLLRRRRR